MSFNFFDFVIDGILNFVVVDYRDEKIEIYNFDEFYLHCVQLVQATLDWITKTESSSDINVDNDVFCFTVEFSSKYKACNSDTIRDNKVG